MCLTQSGSTGARDRDRRERLHVSSPLPNRNISPYVESFYRCRSALSRTRKSSRERDLFSVLLHLLAKEGGSTNEWSAYIVVATIAEGNFHPTSERHTGMRLGLFAFTSSSAIS